MKRLLTFVLTLVLILSLVACGSTGAFVVSGIAIGAKIVRGLAGSASDRDTLCRYYTDHRGEVETVREYAKANWERVPEKYKPALLAINEQLNTCDAPEASVGVKKTTAAAILDALRRAVTFYGELKAAGVV